MARSRSSSPAPLPSYRRAASFFTTGSYGIASDLPIHVVLQALAVPAATGPVAYLALYEATRSAAVNLSLADVTALRDKLSEIIAAVEP